jgi:hypothetical protein
MSHPSFAILISFVHFAGLAALASMAFLWEQTTRHFSAV